MSLKGLEAIGTGPLAVISEAVIIHDAVFQGMLECHPHRLQLTLGGQIAQFLGCFKICVDLRITLERQPNFFAYLVGPQVRFQIL